MISKIACEVFTNPIMEKKCLQKSKSKKSKKNNEKKYQKTTFSKNDMEVTWQKFIMLGFFCVNDNKYVDLKCLQTIKMYSLL